MMVMACSIIQSALRMFSLSLAKLLIAMETVLEAVSTIQPTPHISLLRLISMV
jgi:hypothetical protein